MSGRSPGSGRTLLVVFVVVQLGVVPAGGSGGFVLLAGPPSPETLAPQTLVLQPDGANGTDTFITNVPASWNFGANASLHVGRNASLGSAMRSLLRFDLGALPPGVSIVNATLELFAEPAGSSVIEAHRVAGAWSEGDGGLAWHRVLVTVRETAGVHRTLEPISVPLTFVPYDIGNPARDLRVWSGSLEHPSQVYEDAFSGGHVVEANAHMGVTIGPSVMRQFYVTYSTNETTIPAYRLKTFGTIPLWTSPLGNGTGASSPTVVDLERDGSLEILYGTSDGRIVALNATGTQKWSRMPTFGRAVPWPPQVRDVNGDGSLDVVVATTEPAIVRYSATGGNQSFFGIPSTPYSPPALLDVDGNGILDAVIATDAGIQAYDLFSGALIRTYFAGPTSAPSVTDIDANGQPDLVFAANDGNVHAFATNGTPLEASSLNWTGSLRNSVALGDVSGDGRPEIIVTGNDMFNGTGLEFAYNPVSNLAEWSMPFTSGSRGHQTLADVNGDAIPDVIVGTSVGQVFARNGRNGTVLWSQFLGAGQPLAPAVADLDQDGRMDFVFASAPGPQVRVLNTAGGLVHSWNTTMNNPGGFAGEPEFTTPAIADLDGDGTLEVIVPTGSGMKAFATGGLSRDWRTFGYNWNHTHRVGDGTSPDGVPPLNVTAGSPEAFPASGASWDFSDGVQPWAAPGGDFGSMEDSVVAGTGWSTWNVTSAVTEWYLGTYPNTGLLMYDPSEGTGGSQTFQSSDSANANLRPILRITYTPPSFDPTPRIAGPIQNFAWLEDSAPWSTNLSGLATDDDTPLSFLQWNVSGYDPSVVQITGLNTPGNHDLAFYPRPDAWGSMRATYWLTDPEGHFAWREAWINITPVNDPPWFDPPATLVVKHDLTYVFDFSPYVGDPDDDVDALTLATDDPDHTSVSDFNVSFLFPVSYVDQWVFVGLILSDGRASDGKVVAVKVTEDDPPVVTRLMPDVTMQEGETIVDVFDLDEYFTDPNNDTLFFSYGYSHLTISIRANHSVDISAESDWFGAERVTFRGTDPQGALAEDSIVVTVLPTNDPPVLGPVPDLRVRYDANYTFNLEPYVSDPDTPLEALLVTASSAFVTTSGLLLTLLYPFALNGTIQNLTISVSDGITTASRTIRVTVGDDWPPVLVGTLGDRSFLEDGTLTGAYDLRDSFSDPDGDTLFFSSGNLSVRILIDTLGIVNLSANPNWFGAERVTFRAADGLGALAEDTVWITVLPVNDAPSFRTIPTQYLNATAGLLDLTLFLIDVDTNVSDIGIASPGANVTVVGRSLLFHYRTDANERLEIVASDGFLEGRTFVDVIVRLPRTTERLPPIVWWLVGLSVLGTVASIIVWRYRRVEWVFLVTNGGLMLASVFRQGSATVDTDLMAGMMTAIKDFTKVSFSDETQRELEEFSLGDRRVEIVQGERGYLAVVYAGRSPGRLENIMKSLLAHIEERYPEAFGTLVDTSDFRDLPVLLKRFIDRAWWPFLSFRAKKVE